MSTSGQVDHDAATNSDHHPQERDGIDDDFYGRQSQQDQGPMNTVTEEVLF